MAVTSFGTLHDGTDIPLVTVSGGGVTMGIIGLGAAIRSLEVDVGHGPAPRVLGLQTLADYIAHSPSMGIVAGRYGNRIGGAAFPLDGKEVRLVPNEHGHNQLHGGPVGFGRRAWSLIDHGASHATLRLVSADGDQGYPGELTTTCTYRIAGDGLVVIELSATTDATTVVNLATHSYFNLDGGDTILDHHLMIPADAYTPVDAELIPTGEIRDVAGTPFDFRSIRPIRGAAGTPPLVYDHNFVIARSKASAPRLMARVIGPLSKTELQVHSTEQGVQFYDGSYLGPPIAGLNRQGFPANCGLCLEPQYFPDTPNKPHFGNASLRPGEIYRQRTEYRFRAA